MPSRSSEYRAAMALNNMAIRLQEQGWCNEAFDCLRDASALMGAISGSAESAFVGSVEEKLQRAARRLARYSDKANVCHVTRATTRLSEDADPSRTIEAVSSHNHSLSSRSVFIAFEGGEERHSTLDTAIILHNFGLSCLLLAKIASCNYNYPASQSLCFTAIKALSKSEATLSACDSEFSDDDEVALQKIFMIAAVVNRAMIEALTMIGNKESEVRECVANLETIVAALQDTFDDLGFAASFEHQAAAAA